MVYSKKKLISYLPKLGCYATGVIYSGIGIIALLSFFNLREGGADESSIMMVLNDFVAGQILILLLMCGTVCYIAWRIFEVITDPYRYGSKWKGITTRIGIALSTVADILVLTAGARVLLGIGEIQSNGQPIEERAMTRSLLDAGDTWIVVALGLIVMVTAIVQTAYGFTKGYQERVDDDGFNRTFKLIFHALAIAGFAARGIILGIIGFFFLKAGFLSDADFVVNTDKAFDFIGDNAGPAWFILAALGTIAYGLFMAGLGYSYKLR